MKEALTREELAQHFRLLEEKLERFVADEQPSRGDLVDWMRSELSARILVIEMNNLSGAEVSKLITSTPLT